MAGKFLELNEAASMLGVSPEQLIEMRSQGKIFGYRDGSSWKFKQEEVERVGGELRGDDDGEILSADDNEFANFVTGLSSKIVADKQEDEPESILISDDDMGAPGGSQVTGGSHLGSGIGGSGSMKTGSVIRDGSHKDGDIRLASDSDLNPAGSGSRKPSDILAGGSDKGQGATDLMSGGSDSVHLGDDGELSLDSLDDLSLGSVSSTGDDELKLSDDDSSAGDYALSDESKSKSGSGTGSGTGSDKGSGLNLSGDSPSASSIDKDGVTDFELGLDDEMSVLGDDMPKKGRGSGHGSDVTHGGGDSGINLQPSDGGLSLEDEPMDLGGSAVETLDLQLPDDDEIVELENAADPDQATQLKADDQFMLSPSDALGTDDDSSDSGSQVIALEDSESFDTDAATMLNAQHQLGGDALVAEDAFGAPVGMGGMASSPGMAYGGAPAYAPQPVEIPYSIWQVLSLFILTGILTLAGMLMVDVVANMWTWECNGSAATVVMGAVVSTGGLGK